MISNLHKEISKLLKKHGCANYFIMLIDPDSTDIWKMYEGNRMWIHGELTRWQKETESDWIEERREDQDKGI